MYKVDPDLQEDHTLHVRAIVTGMQKGRDPRLVRRTPRKALKPVYSLVALVAVVAISGNVYTYL